MEDVARTDPDLPQPPDEKHAGILLRQSPFTRKVDPSQSLVLTGVVVIGGKLMAIIHEGDSGIYHLVSEEPNELGWRLVSGSARLPLERTEVEIFVGQERIILRYHNDQLQPHLPATPEPLPLLQSIPMEKSPASIRRLQLDLTGRLPTPEEIRASMSPGKG